MRADFVVAALPSHGTRAVIREAAPFVPRQALIVSATKGLEQDTLLRMSEVIAQELRGARPIAVLSGPSFAMEVARGLPTAVCVACADPVLAEDVQREFRAAYFRLYASTDVVGVEIGGALKNIIAIAAGVVEGPGPGTECAGGADHARPGRDHAAGVRRGCTARNAVGLSGLGDLVLTCTGTLSRNRHVGIELAHGRPISEVVAGMKMVAEGVKTTTAALALGRQHGVELPIATQMAAVLAGTRSAANAVEELMLRPQKTEQESVLMGIFGRLREGLSKTTQQIVQRFDDLVTRSEAPERKGRPVDVDTIDALEELLIMADVGVAATARIVDAVKSQTQSGKSLRDAVKDEIRAIFAGVQGPRRTGTCRTSC